MHGARGRVRGRAGSGTQTSNQRNATGRLAQELDDLAPVEQAIADGLAAAERNRDQLIRELFPELAEGLQRRAAERVEASIALEQQHAAERAAQAEAEHALRDEWMRLDSALPAPLRRRFDEQALRPAPIEPDAGLAHYVAEPDWAGWMVKVLETSRELRDEQRTREAAGMAGYR